MPKSTTSTKTKSSVPQDDEEKRRKPRPKPGNPYDREAKGKKQKNATPAFKSSAVRLPDPAIKEPRKNLALGDWLEVIAYCDEHKDMTQAQIVDHFKTRRDGSGALSFNQGTLSRKLKDREKLEARQGKFANALSSKRDRIVTRPDVERALLLYFKQKEGQGETVTGEMLRQKRTRLENLLNVPTDERLTGNGWVANFCRAHQIKEIRRHGEAASINLADVVAEQARIRKLISERGYALKDIWNIDETGLFCFAVPDRSLSTKGKLSGKKQDKFRITLMFAVNADGSETMPIFFIGKSAMPRCFQKKNPSTMGFYYRNNKKAWMTKELFAEWLRQFDLKMRNRDVVLFLDNFAGHDVSYVPKNVDVEFFEPNLTPFVQPLDAGIIRAFKAHYRNDMCILALDRDDAGEENIWKLTLLDAMNLSRSAWKKVSAQTIANCWKHTKILPDPSYYTTSPSSTSNTTSGSEPPASTAPANTMLSTLHTKAWALVRAFASSDQSLPNVEGKLCQLLGDHFKDSDWRPALKAVMDAENDCEQALNAVDKLQTAACGNPPMTTINASLTPQVERSAVEAELEDNLHKLKERKRLFGELPSVDDLLNLVDELEIGEKEDDIERTDEQLIEEARYQIAVEKGEIEPMEIDEDEDDEGDEDLVIVTDMEGIEMCRKLESLCALHGDAQGSDELAEQLRHFQGYLHKLMQSKLKQGEITDFFKSKQ